MKAMVHAMNREAEGAIRCGQKLASTSCVPTCFRNSRLRRADEQFSKAADVFRDMERPQDAVRALRLAAACLLDARRPRCAAGRLLEAAQILGFMREGGREAADLYIAAAGCYMATGDRHNAVSMHAFAAHQLRDVSVDDAVVQYQAACDVYGTTGGEADICQALNAQRIALGFMLSKGKRDLAVVHVDAISAILLRMGSAGQHRRLVEEVTATLEHARPLLGAAPAAISYLSPCVE
jgi:hypothetical protein